MSKYTPGPWILATVPTSVGSCHKIGPFPNGDRVATFACVYADGHRLGIDDGNKAAIELAANARLIAAAPELLQALQDLLASDRADQFAIVGKDHYGHPVSAPGMARIKARAAIAKALGEAK